MTKDHIIPELNGREKREVLDEMSSYLSERVDGLNKERLLLLLLEREKLGSTGIGHGVAVPHAKIKGIDAIAVAFGRSRKGVDFQGTDNRPVHLVFLIVAPENSTAAHLKMLASVSHLLRDNGLREKLVRAADGEELYRIMVEEEKKLEKGAII